MKQFALACLFLLFASIASAQTTDQVRNKSANGADRWVFWQNLQNVQQGLARETGRPVPQFNNGGGRRRFFGRRRG